MSFLKACSSSNVLTPSTPSTSASSKISMGLSFLSLQAAQSSWIPFSYYSSFCYFSVLALTDSIKVMNTLCFTFPSCEGSKVLSINIASLSLSPSFLISLLNLELGMGSSYFVMKFYMDPWFFNIREASLLLIFFSYFRISFASVHPPYAILNSKNYSSETKPFKLLSIA